LQKLQEIEKMVLFQKEILFLSSVEFFDFIDQLDIALIAIPFLEKPSIISKTPLIILKKPLFLKELSWIFTYIQ